MVTEQATQSPTIVTRASSVQVAILYAVQIVACAVILLAGYRATKAPSVEWAIVTAAVVLQPGLKESLAASMNRIAANLIGAGVGLGIGELAGDSEWQFIVGLIVVIFICERLRLEQSLRSACVAVTIVMVAHGESLVASGVQRTASVVIGSGVALLAQYVTDVSRRRKAQG
jgi:uncharacterized membrane protein YgaE (UPF0421/DUF939 family)